MFFMLFTASEPDTFIVTHGSFVRCAACGSLTRSFSRVITGSPDCHADLSCQGVGEMTQEPACSAACVEYLAGASLCDIHPSLRSGAIPDSYAS